MKDKKVKNGGRKKLVNIISQLAKERLTKSSEDGILEPKEEDVNNKEIEADDNNVVPVDHVPPESRRKSKRKPEKTVKSTCEQTRIEESENEEKIMNELDQVTTEIPESNLTIVEAVPSDDDFNGISEGEKENNENDKKVKKKKTYKTEADSKEKTDASLTLVRCTACNKNVKTKSGKFCRHPDLNTIICKQCYKFFCSGKFTKDEYGVEEFCRWCADGGQLICCDFCEKAFCKKCIKRNIGKNKLEELLKADENEKWSCFCCDPAPISSIIKLCNRVMRLLDLEKDQHSPYKDKRGREIIPGPNRSERRNMLSNLSGEQTIKSENYSPKKTYSKFFQNGIDSSSEDENNKGKSSNNDVDEILVKKEVKTKKTEVINSSEDEGDNSNEQAEKNRRLKSNKLEKHANKSTKNTDDEKDNSDDDSHQRRRHDRKKKSNFKDSSSSEEKSKKANKSNKKRIEKSKSNKESIDSDSEDDVIQRKNKKGPGTKKMSSDEKSDETESSEDVSSDSVIKRKKIKNSKRNREDVSQSSDSESDVEDFSKKRKKKKKEEKSRKDVSQSSDSESDAEDSPKKRKKERNKKKDRKEVSESSESESDVEDFSKKRKKENNKSKGRKEVSESSDSESESDVEDSSKKGKRKKKEKKPRKDVSESLDSESDVEDFSRKRKKTNNKTKSRKVGRWSLRRKQGDDSDSDNSVSDEEDVKRRKSNKKGNKKNKGGKLKRKRKEEDVDEEESDDENVSPSKKGRKKIRKILGNEKLAEATRHARQLEEERRQRLLERTKSSVFDKPDHVDIKEVVLEYKSDGKTPLVEVQEDLVKHLKPHQVEGVKFMYDCTIESVERWKNKEEGGGCILAHVMGLGKTLQVVSLVHTLYESDLVKLRRVLVVCPLNTVLNWQVEFEKWLSVDDRLEVYVLNEVNGNWKRADMLKSWMNYGGVLIMGYAMYRNLSQCSRIKNKHQKKIFKECLVDPGPELVVCDEGHVLRNGKSAISLAMNGIKTKRRIVLTGTPLQNNLEEYHCMVTFIKPNLLGTLKEFSNSFIRPIQNGQCADSTVMDVKLMKRRCHVLHKMLAGCVQRKDYGEIARFLPPKFEYVIKVRLSAKQREMYKYYLDTFLEENKGKGGSLFSDYQALMRIWTHPWSLKLETARKIENFIDSDDDSLKDFVVYSDEEEESAVSSEEMSWTSDTSSDTGKGKRGKRRSKSTSDESEDEKSETEITKTKSKQNTRKQSVKSSVDVKVDPDEPSTSKVVVLDNSDDDIMEVKPNVNEKVTKEGNNVTKEGNNVTKEGNNVTKEGNNVTMVSSTLRSGQEFKDPTEMVEEQEWYDQFLTQEDESNIELGSKIVLLLEILADAAALEEKVLVFSHSLISLDVIEMALGGGEIGGNAEDWCRGCDYFRMDGSTSAQMRKRWADIFNDGENKAARLFLISTKAGGLGINLVGASRVVVFDVSWNPSHDVQSIFRAYRFGQNKPVFIYRFIAEGTMEEKIYDRQVTKLSMSQRVVDEHQIQRHFNANDLAELYRFEPDVLENENDERPTPTVPKDAVLAELINRLYPKWIVKYHEHDSLLENRPEEELTEAERKEAWEHWELEKQGILNAPQVTAEQIQQMMNGVRMPNASVISGPRFNSSYQVRPPQNVPTFVGVQRPANYQQVVLEEQRRRLFEMERHRVQEAQKRAEEQLRRLHQQRQQQQERQRHQEEERKRADEARKRAEQQRLQAELDRQRDQQKRQNAERLRAEEQRRQRVHQQQAQVDRSYLEQLLRARNAYVTQPRSGNPNQQVFQIVMNNNSGSNTTRPQRPNRSPPRIIELPPDA